MDVDGTMTDGSVTLLSQSDGTALEIKTFNAHDGQGLTLAQTAGLRTGCITGRERTRIISGRDTGTTVDTSFRGCEQEKNHHIKKNECG